MFALHETTRKRICRTAFVALCVAPTMATAVWIVARNRPGRAHQCVQALGRSLHVQAAAADWREPRPGVVRAAQLTLADPSTGQSLVEIEGAEWRWRGKSLVTSSEQITVDCAGFEQLAERIDLWLAAMPGATQELRWRQLDFKWPAGPGAAAAANQAADQFVLRDVHGRMERDAAGHVKLRMSGQVQGGGGEQPAIRLTIERSPLELGGVTQAMLETGSAPVPARLFAAIAPGFGSLGVGATFTGTIGRQFDRREHRGVAVGRLDKVDLASAMPAGSPHVLRGVATVEITEMRWHGRQVDRLVGSLQVANAQASPSLVAAARKFLLCASMSDGMQVDNHGNAPEMLAVDRFACRFQLNADGLTITGDFPVETGLPPGCLAVSGLHPLLAQPARSALPASAWVQFMIGPAGSWLPATQEAVDLAERLPLPRVRF